MTFRQTLEVYATPDALFALSQDYGRRLAWDPFLKQAELLEGATEAGPGVRAWCVSRQWIGMETRYVSFHPPTVCAIEMTKGPRFLRSFAASWRFEALETGRTKVSSTYQLVGRPGFLTPLSGLVLGQETRRRLWALKKAAEVVSNTVGSP
jgi:hypothetical protein